MTLHSELLRLKKEVSNHLHHLFYDHYKKQIIEDPETKTAVQRYVLEDTKNSCNVEWRRTMGSGVDLRVSVSEIHKSGILYSTQKPFSSGEVLRIYSLQDSMETVLGYYLTKGNSSIYVSHYTTPIEIYERFPK